MAEFSRIFRHIASMFVLVVLASCSPEGDGSRPLAAAEELMDTRPDSALMILQSIPPGSLGSAGGRALYGLLMTQALDKNYIDVTSDSLIRPAVDYYEDSSDKFRLMKSLYYLAGVDYYRKAYSESLIASFRAYELARQLDDKFWIGMTARRIAEIYGDNYCAKEQMEFARIALDNFRLTDRRPFIHNGIYSLAAAYHANEDYSTARKICHELLDTAVVYGDNVWRRQAFELIGLGYMAKDSFAAARDVFREILPLPTVKVSDSAFYNGMCLRLRRIDDVVGDVGSLAVSGDLSEDVSHWLQYQWYMAHDSISQALDMMRRMNGDTDRALKESRRGNLIGSLTDYHRYKSDLSRIDLRNANIRAVAVVALALLIIFIGWRYGRRRYLRQQILIDEYLTMGDELRRLLAETSSELDEALSRTESNDRKSDESDSTDGRRSLGLLEKYFSEFDVLCRSFRRNPTETSQKRISDSVGSLIDTFADSERMGELEDYADYRYGGIMTKLRTDFPKLKEVDYQIFLLSRLGFSIPTIALVLKKDDDKMFIYNHRKRLKEKFRGFNGTNRELYLEVMP
ncbi:MAG: hypothetical protein K2J28_10455 [Duncaniella sp.]|nr:hypothetical protein [Duncaniella sp.]